MKLATILNLGYKTISILLNLQMIQRATLHYAFTFKNSIIYFSQTVVHKREGLVINNNLRAHAHAQVQFQF